jgi:hypothetical protein
MFSACVVEITQNEVERGELADENYSQLHGDGATESGAAYVPVLSEVENMEESFLHTGAPASAIFEGPDEQATPQDNPEVQIDAEDTLAPHITVTKRIKASGP